MTDLHEQFGNIDIYLFDQLLRGRIGPGMRVLDAGCGGGRNLVYLLRRADIDVFATDGDAAAVASVRALAKELRPALPADRLRVEPVEQPSFDEASMDVVVSNAVLHFARDDAHFDAMVAGMWRMVRPGGVLFARLASTIGMADRMQPLGERTVPAARRQRALPRGRGPSPGDDPPPRRRAARPAQDHRRAGSALHDDVGGRQAGRSRLITADGRVAASESRFRHPDNAAMGADLSNACQAVLYRSFRDEAT